MTRRSIASAIIASTMLAGVAFAAADKASGANAAPPAPPAPTAGTPAAAPKVKAEVLGIVSDIAKPEAAASKSSYPFDQLEVGQSFGVKGKDKKAFNSIIYMAHKRHSVEVKDEAGNVVTKVKITKGKNGAPDTRETVPVLNRLREFEAFDVDPAVDPQGATVRIFRNK